MPGGESEEAGWYSGWLRGDEHTTPQTEEPGSAEDDPRGPEVAPERRVPPVKTP